MNMQVGVQMVGKEGWSNRGSQWVENSHSHIARHHERCCLSLNPLILQRLILFFPFYFSSMVVLAVSCFQIPWIAKLSRG